MPQDRDPPVRGPHDSDEVRVDARDEVRVEVRADWARLATAFSDDSSGVEWYLHVASGELVRASEGDPAAAGLTSEAGYLAVERARSKEQYRWMERFIVRLDDRALAAELAHAIAGKRAFHRFKAVLAAHPGRASEWYEFRNAELTRLMSAWLDAQRLFVPWHPAPSRDVDPTGPQLTPAWVRLQSAAEHLGADDMEALLRMGEFLLVSARERAPAGGED